MSEFYRCYAEISMPAIVNNIKNIRKLLPAGTKLMAVLKADAYGHGADFVGPYIQPYIDAAGVASLEEALELRYSGVKVPILVLGYTSPRMYAEMMWNDITPTIFSEEDAQYYSEEAGRVKSGGVINIAVDTGMTRIGFRADKNGADAIQRIAALPNVKIEGIFTHLSCADMDTEEYSQKQFGEFESLLGLLKERNIDIPVRHMCNSAGIMKYKEHYYDFVRCGIAMYGHYPSDEVDKNALELKPALQWKAHVINIAEVEALRGVSYGATYVTNKEVTRIATLSVGYADGYPRALSSKGEVLINGKRVPIIGKVCMDQMMVDITDAGDVRIEDVATLIGRDGDEFISVEEMAEAAGSFNYEMLCRIGKRVKRKYKYVPELSD